jgi:hypothetical protein
MSGFMSPSTDSVDYKCHGCPVSWSIPASALEWKEVDGVPIEAFRINNDIPTRCLHCALVLGAIVKLNDLVFREPWLLTEGKGGEPKKEAWELVGTEKKDSGHASSCVSSAGDGRTWAESVEFRDKVLANFVETAGKGFAVEVNGVKQEKSEKQEEEQKGN